MTCDICGTRPVYAVYPWMPLAVCAWCDEVVQANAQQPEGEVAQ